MIQFDEKNKIFHLQTRNVSYVMGVLSQELLIHIYYGKRLEHVEYILELLDTAPTFLDGINPTRMDLSNGIAMNKQLLELPTYGDGDYRPPAFHAQYADGSTVSKLCYMGHHILNGKPELVDMPSSYAEEVDGVQTLEIQLKDEQTGIQAFLAYSVYPERDVITRSVRYVNGGTTPVRLKNIDSACMDFERTDFDFIHFYGRWACERQMERIPLFCGLQSVDSTRGSSSHTQNPFVCLASRDATEDYGEVYAMNLVYSGNFHAGAYVDAFGKTRFFTGINPFDFEWMLNCGEEFQTPECVMVYSDEGFTKMSHIYHRFIRQRICRGRFRDAKRPVLINNWEATRFNIHEDVLLRIAEKSSELGIELLVLDDGWFGHRNDACSSLGDWFENPEKFPHGLEGIVGKANELGMKFGLWVEPEMISVDSELYRKHPDWCLHVKNRSRSEGRYQLILDLSREEVCNYIIQTLSELFKRVNIEYVKWDMNRNMTEIGSATLAPEKQREVAHRYMIGLYRILGALRNKFPHILMEGCASGGGRFDLGMLCYFDQIWLSDNSDAVARQSIQNDSSYGYPFAVMGAHVSACPNHQIGRTTPFHTRGFAAMPGQFGYELDPNQLSKEEQTEIRKQIKLYKELQEVFHEGDFYRICSPEKDKKTIWEFISPDKKTIIVVIFTVLAIGDAMWEIFRLKGLKSDALYQERSTGKCYWGDTLMNIGLRHARKCDYEAELIIFEELNL